MVALPGKDSRAARAPGWPSAKLLFNAGGFLTKAGVFSGDKMFSLTKNPVFLTKTIFSLTEKMFFLTKKMFFAAKKKFFLTEKKISLTKKKISLNEKMFFLTEKKVFSVEKTAELSSFGSPTDKPPVDQPPFWLLAAFLKG